MNTHPYDRNSPYYLKRSINLAERKLKELKLRQEISVLDYKLKLLREIRNIYPKDAAPNATDEMP